MHTKIWDDVREMRKRERGRMEQELGLGVHYNQWNRRSSPTAKAEVRAQLPAAWGLSSCGVLGQTREGDVVFIMTRLV